MDVTDDIKRTVAKVLKTEPDQLKPESKLSDFAADSLDVIELVYLLEEKFDISIVFAAKESSFVVKLNRAGKAQEVEFDTVGDIINAVQQLVDAKAG
jgi:acyl carrier protein